MNDARNEGVVSSILLIAEAVVYYISIISCSGEETVAKEKERKGERGKSNIRVDLFFVKLKL